MTEGTKSARSPQSGHAVVTSESNTGIPLKDFLAGIKELTHDERALIVQQAIMVLEGLHVNLPLKCAMYAVDPLRRLQLLQQRLPTVFSTDRLFHREMTRIFNSLNDLHTNYLLPAPYKEATAFLPFTVEFCYQGKRPTYLVTEAGDIFKGTPFGKGVEILDWNGVPMSRAMEVIGAQSPSGAGNLAARHALGVYTLTVRPLRVLMPPDEEWVVVGYRIGPRARKRLEIQAHWSVTGVSKSEDAVQHGSVLTQGIQKLRKLRSAPKATDAFRAQAVATPDGKFGLLRIFTFDRDAVDIRHLIAGIKSLPRKGLIIDVRENSGGRTATAEQLLQVISPNYHYPKRKIEPQRLCFINTPRTLELCKLQEKNLNLGPDGLHPWIESIQRAMQTGATFSAGFPFTDPKSCNVKKRWRYPGPVIVVTDGLTRSAAEIFTAGFQDHGGAVLGVDEVTAGAGSNVRFHSEFMEYFKKAQRSPFKTLPRSADLYIPFRRFQRVGPQAGHEIEDFGVRRDYSYRMTPNDVLNGNVDLYNHAARILVEDLGARGMSN